MTAGTNPSTPPEPELPDRLARLVLAAQKIADQIPDFFQAKGPGKGDHASLAFMAKLREAARSLFGENCHCEHKVCRSVGFAFDFYFPDEGAVVEVAA